MPLLPATAPPARAADEARPPPLVAPGAALYLRHCAVCHGREGRGDGPFRGVLRVAPADLTRIAARNDGEFPADRVAGHVDGRFEVPAHGPREMPIWGRRLGEPIAEDTRPDEVVRGEILALVEYLRTLQRAE
jgi:mono/diheme cytochrome c family protein